MLGRLMREGAASTLSNPHMNEINVPETTFAGGRIRKRGLALFAVGITSEWADIQVCIVTC